MKKILVTFMAFASITGAVQGSMTYAQEVQADEENALSNLVLDYDETFKKMNEDNTSQIDDLDPGQKLTITPEKTHVVKKGESLWKIANDYQVDISDIQERNQLGSNIILPGQKLTIHDFTEKVDSTIENEKAGNEQAVIVNTSTDKNNAKVSQSKHSSTSSQSAKKTNRDITETTKTSSSGTKELTVSATAYTANCKGCSGITATGVNLKANPNIKLIAVDPNVIPLGSKVYVEGYGYATANDTGGAIKGNKIDVFIPSQKEAENWGRKTVKVKVLN